MEWINGTDIKPFVSCEIHLCNPRKTGGNCFYRICITKYGCYKDYS